MSAHKQYCEFTTEDIVGLENENQKLRSMNTELLTALKEFHNGASLDDPWSGEFLESISRLIAKTEGME